MARKQITAKQLELYNEVKRLSKRANQRLVRLEQAGVFTPAYNIAINDIKHYLGRENSRFIYNKSLHYNELEQEKRAITRFLNSESSTKRGLENVIKRREATFKKNFGRDLETMTNVYKFFNSKAYQDAIDLGIPSKLIVSMTTEYTSDFKYMSRKISKSIKDGGSILDDINRFVENSNGRKKGKEQKTKVL